MCQADIITKEPTRVEKYLTNFDKVEEMFYDLEERDKIRNFQSVITGEMIMQTFDLKPSKEVGIIKENLREAILEDIISNYYETGFQFMLEEVKKLGLEVKNIINL